MNFKLWLAPALLCGAMLAGCIDDIPGPDAKELYTRDFVKTFGVFDPKHDWSYATRTAVTVNTTENSDIKILADVSGSRYVFGTYLNVNGSAELKVDIPKGVDKLYVKANGQTYTTIPGGTVNIASRTWGSEETEGSGTGDGLLTYSPTENKRFIPIDPIAEYLNLVPEDVKENGLNVDTDFYFISDGIPVTFYPVYWNSSSWHALGVYWLDKDGHFTPKNMKDVYYTKSKEIQWTTNYDGTKVLSPAYIECTEELDGGSHCDVHDSDVFVVSEGESITVPDNNDIVGFKTKTLQSGNHYHKKDEPQWMYCNVADDNKSGYNSEPYSRESAAYYHLNVKGIQTKGMTIQFPAGTRWGFYLKVSSRNSINPKRFVLDSGLTGKFAPTGEYSTNAPKDVEQIRFSQALRNKYYNVQVNGSYIIDGDDYKDIFGVRTYYQEPVSQGWDESYIPCFDQTDENALYSNSAYKTFKLNGKNYTFFSFEDWHYAPDLNDVVFMFDEGYVPRKDDEDPEETAFPWIIACEDLGLNDFDFNDVVFGVSAPEADYDGGSEVVSQKVKVYPLAAGGTLPISLWYTNEKGEKKCVSPNGEEKEFHSYFGAASTSVVNAHTGKLKTSTPEYITITVDKNWSMVGEDGEIDHTNIYDEKNGHMGGFFVKVNGDERRIEAPQLGMEIGSAPQMLCVPSTWFWPIERQPIHDVYEHFEDWAGNRNSNTDWHEFDESSHRGKVVEHQYGSTSGGNSGGSTTPGGDDKTEPKEPEFSLTKAEIIYGETSQIRVGNSTSLAGITLSDIKYSNAGVVEVSANGLVTALKAGMTTITFTSTGTNDYKASTGSVTITVKEITPTFKLDNTTIGPGGTAHIVLSDGSPLGEIKLESIVSSPSGIVTVSADGTITANSNVSETTVVEITFGSKAVTGRYASTSGNTETIKVVTSDPTIEVSLTPDGPSWEENIYLWGQPKECVIYRYDLSDLTSKFADAKAIKIKFDFDQEYLNYVQTFLSCNSDMGNWNAAYHDSRNPYVLSDENIQTIQESKHLWIAHDKGTYTPNVSPDYNGSITFVIEY